MFKLEHGPGMVGDDLTRFVTQTKWPQIKTYQILYWHNKPAASSNTVAIWKIKPKAMIGIRNNLPDLLSGLNK